MIRKFYCSKVENHNTKTVEFQFKAAKQPDHLVFNSLEETINYFKSLKLNATMWLRENGIFVSSIKTRIGEEEDSEVEVEIVHFEPKKKEVEVEWNVSDDCEECKKLDASVEAWNKVEEVKKEEVKVVSHSSSNVAEGNCNCEMCAIASSIEDSNKVVELKDETLDCSECKECSEFEEEDDNKCNCELEEEKTPILETKENIVVEEECLECKLEAEVGSDCYECKECDLEENTSKVVSAVEISSDLPNSNSCEVCENNVEIEKEECKGCQLQENEQTCSECDYSANDNKEIISSTNKEVELSHIDCDECLRLLEIENQNLINGCNICDSFVKSNVSPSTQVLAENEEKSKDFVTLEEKNKVEISSDCEACAKANQVELEEKCSGCEILFKKSDIHHVTNLESKEGCQECYNIEQEIAKWNAELNKYSTIEKEEQTIISSPKTSSVVSNKENPQLIINENSESLVVSGKVLVYHTNEKINVDEEYVLVKKSTKEAIDVEVVEISSLDINTGTQNVQQTKESIWTRTNYVLWFIFWILLLLLLVSLLIFFLAV
ncbi:hypothetical protein [Mycoplasma sp. Z386]